MTAQRQRDTAVEVALRSALHRLGLRFRIDRRPLATLRQRADLVFVTARVAVFVDGCFWHGCPEHATWPRTNAAWWRDKLEANRARDARTNAALQAAGWTVVRVWEHASTADSAARVAAIVRRRSTVVDRPGAGSDPRAHR